VLVILITLNVSQLNYVLTLSLYRAASKLKLQLSIFMQQN